MSREGVQDGRQAAGPHGLSSGTGFSSWLFPSSAASSSLAPPGQDTSGIRGLESGSRAAAPCEAESIDLGALPATHDARDHASTGVPASPGSARGWEDGTGLQGQEGRLSINHQEHHVSLGPGDATRRQQQHAGSGPGPGTRGTERRGSRERHSGGDQGPQASASEAPPGIQGPASAHQQPQAQAQAQDQVSAPQSNLYQLQLQQQLLHSWAPGSGTKKKRTPSASPSAPSAQHQGPPGTPFSLGLPGSKFPPGWVRVTCSTAVALAAICLAISLINLALAPSADSLFLGMALPEPPAQPSGEQQFLLERLSSEMQKGRGHGDDGYREGEGLQGKGQKGEESDGRGGEGGKGGRQDRREDKENKEDQQERRRRQKDGDRAKDETEGKGSGKRGGRGRGRGRGKRDGAKEEPREERYNATLFADDPAEARARVPLSASCNVSDGRWVRDDSYPLWRQGSCLLDQAGFSCQRPDTYAPYRWQPRNCIIPRFIGADVRERLRGRRLAFVGDSLARNQFQSAVCMLAAGLPNGTVTNVAGNEWGKGAQWVVYQFHDFNFTVEFILSHYQVPVAHRNNDTYLPDIKLVLDTGTVDWAIPGKLLKPGNLGSLIVVFNAGHWYTEGKLMKRGLYFQVNGTTHPDMPLLEGYRAALGTLAAWMQELQEQNVTTVWRTYVPTHFLGGAWDTGGSCRDKYPMPGLEGWKEDQVGWMTASQQYLEVMLEAARSVPRPPLILDVTHMSLLRSDAHIGEFAHNKFDCSHWCMPGVPDIWNELLFATLELQGLL